nr:MAG TPA: hypothetical protein [Crassvirales sp.]
MTISLPTFLHFPHKQKQKANTYFITVFTEAMEDTTVIIGANIIFWLIIYIIIESKNQQNK